MLNPKEALNYSVDILSKPNGIDRPSDNYGASNNNYQTETIRLKGNPYCIILFRHTSNQEFTGIKDIRMKSIGEPGKDYGQRNTNTEQYSRNYRYGQPNTESGKFKHKYSCPYATPDLQNRLNRLLSNEQTVIPVIHNTNGVINGDLKGGSSSIENKM